MHDPVDAVERLVHELSVADIAVQEAHAVRELRRAVAVHLLLEAVENDDLLAELDEGAHEVRTDEAGTAGNERSHGFER